jgi:pimeloyl-ACP methyl ester carboxylesterase
MVSFMFPSEDVGKIDPDAHRDFTELCVTKGYPVESHWVTTDDGYILRMYRIGAKNAQGFNTNGEPVLF